VHVLSLLLHEHKIIIHAHNEGTSLCVTVPTHLS
jgi:hypothetical protein